MAKKTIVDVSHELAKEALELQVEVNKLSKLLDGKKEELRHFANGKKLNIAIEGIGKVDITEPREGSEVLVLTFDEEKLKAVPELKAKLIQKGIAKEEIKKISGAKASVRITPNV